MEAKPVKSASSLLISAVIANSKLDYLHFFIIRKDKLSCSNLTVRKGQNFDLIPILMEIRVQIYEIFP